MKNLPQLGSTVRIVNIGLPVWSEAEKFFGADCTLCAVFMTGDTQMVAVEHQADAVCCCFRADMVRTPEQALSEERDKAIEELYFTINWNEGRDTWPIISSGRKADYAKAIDAGYRKQPAP